MAEHLEGERTGLEVAVVGMAGRFPGAGDIDAFWSNLREGVECITFFTREEQEAEGVSPAVLDHPGYVRARGVLRGADEIDAALFGLTPRDAQVLDPQHRVLLECAWSALEHAGYDPARPDGPIGVFAGSGTTTYQKQVESNPEVVAAVGPLRVSLWNEKDQLAAGISYRLNLRGPALAVQTACSTSLVAVHLACQSLINGECDIALAGGVSIGVPQRRGYFYTPDGIGSPDGHCRALDAGAAGSVGGSGAGMVALKRLDQALADGDTVHAVIRGSAINNDGAQKVGYTAPSVAGQAGVVSEALSVAGVDPATLQYVETHGTGTPLGDAIELKALAEVLARGGGSRPCAIGSVKPNVGHLDTAAGVTGLIKTVLALEHREIPPSLNCAVPNPEIHASGGHMFVNTELRPWERNATPRRAGVSSFGIGGTNAHAVLEEAPPREPSGPSRPLQLLPLSARTPEALARAALDLADFLERKGPPLADAAFTLQRGRRELEHRLAVVCADAGDGAARLRDAAVRATAAIPRTDRPVALMFPGVGTQHVDMGRGLYEAEPAYREAVDTCCELLLPVVGSDLREVMFTPGGEGGGGAERGGGWNLRRLLGRGGDEGDEGPRLDETRFAQPAMFVVEYALATLWMSWGVHPRALIGHSLGEYVAACVAGVLRLEDALRLVALRARLIDALPPGAMLAVPLGEAALREILPAALDVAAVNTPESCVVAGPPGEIEAFEAALAGREIVSRRLPARHAFHSRAMEQVADGLERLLAGFELRAPEIPFVSNVTGTWITDQAARSPAYWARHLSHTVRFADGVATLRGEPGWVLLEAGPGQTLGAWAMQHPAGGERQAVLSSLRHQHNQVPDLRFLLDTLAGLWAAGVGVDWKAFSRGERRHRVPLPGYPFERRRYWVDTPAAAVAGRTEQVATTSHEKGPHTMENLPAAAERAESSPRRQVILQRLTALTAEMTGIEERHVDTGTDFFQAGFDSLLLLQAIQTIEKRIGVRVSLVELLEEITTLGALAAHLDRALPAEVVLEGTPGPAAEVHPRPAPAPDASAAPRPQGPSAVPAPPAFYPPPGAPALPAAGESGGQGPLEQLIARQYEFLAQQSAQHFQLMSQQLAALRGEAAAPPAPGVVAGEAVPPAGAGLDAPVPRTVPQSPRAKIQPETFVAYQPLNTEAPAGMTAGQKEYLDGFMARYVERTRTSKAHQARYHLPLADSRVTARFRRAWKEILYPIAGERAAGSRIWDPDGNEYVDIGMAYGCGLFGHAPDFVTRAMQEQIERGYGLGPQSLLAGRAAELVCELGGNERAVFCNSGTEAVMGAIRAARAYTGRSRIAYFSGSYHGWADSVVGRPFVSGDRREVRPSAPGVPALPLGDVLMLDFDEPSSLEVLARHAGEIAVVLVEPVQSRRPDLKPFAFLRELRRITREAGALLLFDELITGFRMGAGGAQAFFGIDADLVTYGKIVAGGLPMGVVAGTREVMSVFDGGLWNYGDDSYPTGQRTLFAGAYFKHPLSMAVACAILEEIRRRGPAMYDRLEERTTRLVDRINAFFESGGYPITAAHFSSSFRFFFGPEIRFPDLFNHHLVHEGIYVIPETGTYFLSTAHSDDDLEKVFQAIRASAEAMRRGGFIPGPAAGTPALEGGEPAGAEPRVLPLTEGQRQLWIESQMGDDANRAYVESTSIRLHGALDAGALTVALQGLVDRHDTLRITIAPDGDAQLVHPSLRVELPVEDFRGTPPGEREARVSRWVRATVQRPFDLEHGPLVRFALAAVADDEHVLLFDSHHAALDGWSFGVLWKELDTLYTAARDGRPAGLPPVSDHAGTVRSQVAAVGDDSAALAYWLEQFADGAPVLDLPGDRPRPPARSYRGERLTRTLRGGLVERLAQAGRPHGFTLFNTLYSACFVWLSRLAEQDDVVVGTPAAGQAGRAGARDMVGYGINVLPLRVRVDGASSFLEHARAVRRALLRGLEHQAFSFPRLVDTLLRSRDPSRPPVFAVGMHLDRTRGEASLGGLRAEFHDNFGGGSKVDLNLGITETDDELEVRCDYSTDLFDHETVERWLGLFERLLEQVAADPGTRLRDLALIGPEERRRVLEEWNRTETAVPPASIQQQVQEQAALAPGAVALEWEGGVLTRGGLNERANRLAHHLAGLGVGPEVRVGLLLERGPELVVSMLAVLRAGGAYVPLDAAHPADRLGFMLADSAAAVLVTRGGAPAGMALPPGLRVVSLDEAGDALAGHPAGPPPLRAAAGNLAYVIYTSGSTGTPKGVAVEHGALANVCAWHGRALRITPADRSAQLISAGFDGSVLEIWPPLACGARVQLVPDGLRGDPPALRDWMVRRETTLATTPVSLTEPLLALEWPAAGALRWMVSGADRLRVRPGAGVPFGVTNNYGPTECTAIVTSTRVEAEGDRAPCIGRPGDNSRVFVLDAALHPAPVGVPGELFVGGAQVARGYLGRPALTAERFVPDPFAARPGSRLYRTGDRVRWLADGTLDFVGRRDAQVKVRGFRIEPGEIETVLRRHPGVADCAVVPRDEGGGGVRLAAYVVGPADADTLRAHLRRSLPEYMVPAAFVALDALPLTPNGKLDGRALPAPEYATGQGGRAPGTPAEVALAGIWAEVLGVEQVGVDDGFFEIGGDSILAIQVASRARRAGLQISPRHLFEHQSVAALARAAGPLDAPARPAGQAREQGSAPLTPIQALFLGSGHPEPWHFNQSVLLKVDPAVSDAHLDAALAKVVRHHDGLRLRFRETAAGWEQWHADDAGIVMERVDLAGLSEDEQDRARHEAASERQAGLHLEHGPLGRAVLFDEGARGRVLLLVLHHLVVDGVSWRVLRDDLERACTRLKAGKPVDLGPRTTSYARWAGVLRAYAAGGAPAAEAGYWLAQGPDGIAPLPLDGPAGGTVAGERSVAVQLDAGETSALLHEVPAAYRTQVGDVLLAALCDALGRWTGSPRVRLSLEGHGREEEIADGVDLTRTVGWFTTVFPLVLDTSGATGPGDRLKRVKEQVRAIPRRGIGYGVLRYLGPDAELRARLAGQADPEVVFNYLGQFDSAPMAGARLAFAGGARGREWSPLNRRRCLLEVNGQVLGGCLRLEWTYSEGTHRRETVERLAEACLEALRATVAHCREQGAGGFTPSDFPLAELTQEQLDALPTGMGGLEDLYPLSPMQAGMLYHALSGAGDQAYQVQLAHRLEGTLDVPLLRRAWAEVMARHSILRTSFVWKGLPRPLQRVHTRAELPWTEEDWTPLSAGEQEAALERYLAADHARGYALDEPPLMRCALLRVGADAHWLVWSQHHLLTDGWSAARVWSEVTQLYEGWRTGQVVELGRVRPYRDYVAWVLRQDEGAAECYWRGVLAGFASPTPLPSARPAEPGAAMRPAERVAVLPAGLTRRLEEAARGMQVTLNTLAQGAWGLVLSRYAGEDDVVFGTTVSSRPAELDGAEEMAGVFINTLPVRMRVPGHARAGAWLAEVQRGQAAAREFEYTSLVQVQGWSEVPRGTPLFESHFIFEKFPAARAAEEPAAPRLRVAEARGVDWNTYPLSLMVVPGRELVLGLSYDGNRFDEATIERIQRHVGVVLEQLADAPGARLSALRMMGDDERRMVVEEWNRTDAEYPGGVCIHQLFEAQADRTPDAPAVVFGGDRLTYRELDEHANRLAHHLAGLGVGPEVRVGLCLERGPELMAAMLGVMKAGGAYVPVDPGHPAERIGYVMDDAAASVVLTQQRLRDRIPVGAGVRVVVVDAEGEGIGSGPAARPESGVTSENLAYVIYTSGSTGRPKGVAMHHRGVANYVHWGVGHYGARRGNGSPVFSSMAVDLTITNLLPLFAGLPVHLLPEENAVEALAEALRAGPGFGLVKITPVHLSLLTPLLTAEQARAAAHTLVIGADFLSAEPTVFWQENAPGVRLMNEYGPTETVVGCSAYTLPPGRHRNGPVPVGGPIHNLKFYVLDADLRPVPVGVPGELHVGGAGVARGYHGRPALSAEKFVPDPFAGAGARMYRTGDRARWLDGGNLMILGRTDRQVKLRGHRVELGEVEGVLLRHPSVTGCVAMVREDEPGDRRLVAYVAGVVDADELRAHVGRTLPGHMVPSAFVVLDQLPRSATGKLDPRSFPAPDYAREPREYQAPRTPVEEVLAGIWSEVLQVDRVGTDDGFFALGGHSLLAMRLAGRVQATFGVELPIHAVFSATSLEAMAAGIERAVYERVLAMPEPQDEQLALTPAGGG
ncbi:non-ribosomal peptide synthetase/type I polyketide synthase [Longimicrobium sp.]|jgi:amino acid adenylation domain-containing protein/non-ribosomal peptide synthase protein (TIGR01720 family)|uniref:non-ribosomal peptide synthetase/type I polyketide synthase n=1 Tax=Longimicrobium sp. TaxID=2029185 RepID=UPI002EDAFF43